LRGDVSLTSAATYAFDWEFAENPDVTSCNYAQVGDASYDGGFGPNFGEDQFVIDQRGFKYIFIQEAKQFLKTNDPRLILNTTVKNIKHSDSGVTITAKDGHKIEADYAISTFS
jgi:polyamine oxidase